MSYEIACNDRLYKKEVILKELLIGSMYQQNAFLLTRIYIIATVSLNVTTFWLYTKPIDERFRVGIRLLVCLYMIRNTISFTYAKIHDLFCYEKSCRPSYTERRQ